MSRYCISIEKRSSNIGLKFLMVLVCIRIQTFSEIIEHTETRDVKESQSVVVPAVGGLLVGVAITLVVMAIGCIVYRKRFAG